MYTRYDAVRDGVRRAGQAAARLYYVGEPKPSNPYRREDYRARWRGAFEFQHWRLVDGETGGAEAGE